MSDAPSHAPAAPAASAPPIPPGPRPAPGPAWRSILALLLLVPAPTLGVLLGLTEEPTALSMAAFAGKKVWILALPITWLLLVDRARPRLPRPTRRGLAIGLGSGVAVFAVIVAAYVLVRGLWIDPGPVRDKLAALGLGNPLTYLAGALYWTLLNSLLEEYVWRWFTFTRCLRLMPMLAAAALSGTLFATHHVFALHYYFDWPIVLLGSLGVFVGGAFWCWLYAVTRDLWGAWLSHVLADAAIFAIGAHLLFA
ncbi:MAG: CPBP family intramembrane glutamic endopeptidase [Phycisphaeraceae bacterium]